MCFTNTLLIVCVQQLWYVMMWDDLFGASLQNDSPCWVPCDAGSIITETKQSCSASRPSAEVERIQFLTCTHTHTHMHIHMRTHMRACMHTRMHMHTHARTHTHIHVTKHQMRPESTQNTYIQTTLRMLACLCPIKKQILCTATVYVFSAEAEGIQRGPDRWPGLRGAERQGHVWQRLVSAGCSGVWKFPECGVSGVGVLGLGFPLLCSKCKIIRCTASLTHTHTHTHE